jgi:hypothetical protein
MTNPTADTIKTRMREMPSSTCSTLSTGCTVYTITPSGRLDFSVSSLEFAMAAPMLWVVRDVSMFDTCDGVASGGNRIEKFTMILDCCKRRLALPYTVIETICTADASTPAMSARICIIESAIVMNTSSESGKMSSILTVGASTGVVDGSGGVLVELVAGGVLVELVAGVLLVD